MGCLQPRSTGGSMVLPGLLSIACCLLLRGAFGQSTCPSPTRFNSGQLQSQFASLTSFPVGTRVSYECRPGYTSISGKSKTIECQNNFQWTVIPEFCERKDCRDPGEPQNGQTHYTLGEDGDPDTKFGATVNFTCNDGYRLVGRNNRLCEATGWTNAVPTCDARICGPPPEIASGTHSGTGGDYPYPSAVSYTCKATFTLIGSSTIYCTKDGFWSVPTPQCAVISCLNVFVENAEKVSGFGAGPFKYQESIEFKCKAGFSMRGSAVVTCSKNSDWQPPLPTCRLGVEASTTVNPTKDTIGRTEASTTVNPTKDTIGRTEASTTVNPTKDTIGRTEASTTVNPTKDTIGRTEVCEACTESNAGSNASVLAGNLPLLLMVFGIKWSLLHFGNGF
ncbi:membrane cofactor protein-like isoform X6 [Ambystoma mexicanum]|uniref:membrane cofactor protein-like isoform X6 n=1 Tax=Ambystoma mexicanum TaxID=8296 RepID=UPI0037E8816A